MSARNIFISHTHADKEIADAFRDAVSALFGSYLTLSYSTDTEHGPKQGAQWLESIHQQVRTSDFTLVLLTPVFAEALDPLGSGRRRGHRGRVGRSRRKKGSSACVPRAGRAGAGPFSRYPNRTRRQL